MRRRSLFWSLLFCVALAFIAAGTACETMPNGNGNENSNSNNNSNDNTNPADFNVVITEAVVHNGAGIVAGDDLIVFGTGGFSGVQYIIPSEGDTTGRDFPSNDTFVASTFNIVGKKIVCYSGDFAAHVYDTENDTLEDIDLTEVRLTNIPTGRMGRPQSGDSYVVVRCDDTVVTDGNQLKIIDVTGATPSVVPFTSYPMGFTDISHAAVDKVRNKVVAVSGTKLFVYDPENPDTAPVEVDTSTHETDGNSDPVDTSFPIQVEDGVVLLIGDQSGIPHLLNLDSLEYTALATEAAIGDFELVGGSYGFFIDSISIGADFASGIGAVSSATTTVASEDDLRFENTTNGGAFGLAQEIAITLDGGTWFISGDGSIGFAETLQVSTGGKFVNVPDPEGQSELGVPATNVSVSANVVAFKTGADVNTTVGYIVLE